MEYKELRQIDVSKYTEKKNNLTYLSWAWAVDQLLLADPKAHWFYPEYQRWGNGSVMVFCTVIANDIARTAQLPVMDYRNKPISEPDSFAVNTAMLYMELGYTYTTAKTSHRTLETLSQCQKCQISQHLRQQLRKRQKRLLKQERRRASQEIGS